ncbi:MAG: hypothetical protein NZ561_06855 [Phycisphaerae bacterium]|nr:hypothetical protein [Phycisphaerae bacterium]MDW8261299.1 hypothetical protein [Phycisphaerales bacterium]
MAFLLIVAGLTALRWSSYQTFAQFLFNDAGAYLRALELSRSDGLTLVQDAFPYGLLPIVTGRLYALLFGETPSAVGGLMALLLVARSAIVLGFALTWRRGGSLPGAVALLAMTPLISSPLPSPFQALEALCLTLALVMHACRRVGAALACATAGVFCKPGLGYVYLALLVVELAVRRHRRGLWGAGHWLRSLAPAGLMALGTLALLGLTFGAEVTARTLFPGAGARLYEAADYGFFRSGAHFWNPAGKRWTYYLGTPAGLWLLLLGIVLTAGAGALICQLRGRRRGWGRQSGCVIASAGVCLVWVACGFGNANTYAYYAQFLVVPTLAVMAHLREIPRFVLAVLITCLGVTSAVGEVKLRLHERAGMTRSAETCHLWAPRGLAEDWSALSRQLGDRQAVLLGGASVAHRFDKRFRPPPSSVWWLMRGTDTPQSIRDTLAELHQVDHVVLPLTLDHQPLGTWPEFAGALSQFRVAWSSAHFRLLSRIAPAATAPDRPDASLPRSLRRVPRGGWETNFPAAARWLGRDPAGAMPRTGFAKVLSWFTGYRPSAAASPGGS